MAKCVLVRSHVAHCTALGMNGVFGIRPSLEHEHFDSVALNHIIYLIWCVVQLKTRQVSSMIMLFGVTCHDFNLGW